MLKPWQAVLLSLILLAAGGLPKNAALAQAPLPEGQQLAMTLLPIVHQGDLTYIITPKGFKVQVPGSGVAKNAPAVAVYQDPQRNYWYINKKGEPTPVKPATVQSVMAQLSAQYNAAAAQQQVQAMPPQMMQQQPAQAPVQQTTIIQQPGTSSGGSGVVAGVNAAAAGMNLAGGILNATSAYGNYGAYGGYHGVPYGRPIYPSYANGHNNYYYNNSSGNKTYVNANKNNSAYLNEFNKQGTWNNRSQWSKNIHSGVQPIENAGRRFSGGGRRFR
jgi:hypothetical protein